MYLYSIAEIAYIHNVQMYVYTSVGASACVYLQCICMAWTRACSIRLKITQAIYAQVLSSGNYLSLKKIV